MPFTLHSNVEALNVRRNLLMTQHDLASTLARLSSGLRINKAGDDAAGLGISEKLRSQSRGLNIASRNAQDGISMLQTAETAMGEQHTIIQRMRELAVQAASDTLTAEDRNNIQTEINSLIREIDRLGRATEFNTLRLLDAYNVNPITLQIGARDGQIIGITLLVANSSSAGYAISGLAVTSHAAASLAIASLDNALSIISTERARLGSLENRLEFAIANLNSAHEKITSAESRIRDADIALETLNMTRQQILQQAGVAAQAQANLIPQALLALLG